MPKKLKGRVACLYCARPLSKWQFCFINRQMIGFIRSLMLQFCLPYPRHCNHGVLLIFWIFRSRTMVNFGKFLSEITVIFNDFSPKMTTVRPKYVAWGYIQDGVAMTQIRYQNITLCNFFGLSDDSKSKKKINKPTLRKSDLNVVAYLAKARIMCKISKGSVNSDLLKIGLLKHFGLGLI